MKHQLYEKSQTTEPYSQKELGWLLDHVGDSDASIRDDLVYASFCHALLDGLVKTVDFVWLADQVIKRNLLFYKIEEVGQTTLTRSFSALLGALLIGVDGDETSPYHLILPENLRTILFQSALEYLQQETDSAGFSAEFGWVHAFAHGADFLLYASLHDKFPYPYEVVWSTIVSVFKQQAKAFTAGESDRLATIVVQLLLIGKIQAETLLQWLVETEFPHEADADYLTWINYQQFLRAIYVELDHHHQLTDELRTALYQVCN